MLLNSEAFKSYGLFTLLTLPNNRLGTTLLLYIVLNLLPYPTLTYELSLGLYTLEKGCIQNVLVENRRKSVRGRGLRYKCQRISFSFPTTSPNFTIQDQGRKYNIDSHKHINPRLSLSFHPQQRQGSLLYPSLLPVSPLLHSIHFLA